MSSSVLEKQLSESLQSWFRSFIVESKFLSEVVRPTQSWSETVYVMRTIKQTESRGLKLRVTLKISDCGVLTVSNMSWRTNTDGYKSGVRYPGDLKTRRRGVFH